MSKTKYVCEKSFTSSEFPNNTYHVGQKITHEEFKTLPFCEQECFKVCMKWFQNSDDMITDEYVENDFKEYY